MNLLCPSPADCDALRSLAVSVARVHGSRRCAFCRSHTATWGVYVPTHQAVSVALGLSHAGEAAFVFPLHPECMRLAGPAGEAHLLRWLRGPDARFVRARPIDGGCIAVDEVRS